MKHVEFLSVLLLSPFLALPAQAETLSQAAQEVARTLAARPLHSLAIKGIIEEQTMARWPLSERVEKALNEALLQHNPPYPILGLVEKAPGTGPDAYLKGTFQWRQSEHAAILSLYLQDPKSQQIFHQFKPIRLDGLSDEVMPAAPFGRLVLTLNVPEALVFIDGKPVGKGSQTLPLPSGFHSITAVAQGYGVYDSRITLKSGEPTWQNIDLTPTTNKQSSLAVDSDVPGALVTVDGKEKGNTPLAVALALGKHSVVVSKTGYRSYETQLDYDPAKTQGVQATLTPLPANLVVTADIPDSEVLMDGRSLGKTPLLVSDLAVGHHQLVVQAPGYAPFMRDIALKSQQTLNIRASLDPETLKNEQAEAESRFSAIAVIPIQETPEDLELANRFYPALGENVIPPKEALPVVKRILEGKPWDDKLFPRLAQALQAKEIIRVGVSAQEPFSRLAGFWPHRPEIEATVQQHYPNYCREQVVSYRGGEPWGFRDNVPDSDAMVLGLSKKLATVVAGKKPLSNRPTLANELMFFGGGNLTRFGFSCERRLFSFLSLRAGYSYGLGQALSTYTILPNSGAGEAILYGIKESHQGRLDAILRFDSLPEKGPFYEGSRWIPYLGFGYRYLGDYYGVNGAGSRALEGTFWQQHQRGVALAGLKLSLGGTLLGLEMEYPVIYQNNTSSEFQWNLGLGWMF